MRAKYVIGFEPEGHHGPFDGPAPVTVIVTDDGVVKVRDPKTRELRLPTTKHELSAAKRAADLLSKGR